MDRGFFEFSAMIGLTFFTSSLPSALTAVVLYKLAGHFTKKRKAQLFAALVYGLATLAFPHALHFWHHPISTFLIFLSFYLIFLCRYKPRLYHFVLAGTLCGFAATTDAFATVFLPFLLIYSLGMDRRLGSAFFFASLVGSLPLLLYNQAVLGQPFGSVSAYIDRQIYRRAYPFLRSSFEALWTQAMRYLHLEKLPNPYVMLRILVYPYRGLFFYSPILLLGLCGLVLMRKSRKREVLLTIAVLLTLLAVISMRRNWWGGYAFGHRYLLPMVPFLALFLVPVAERLNSKWILPLFALGIFVNLLGLQPAEDWAYDWNRMDMRADWHARQNSFGALANPLLDHYWPRFLRDGPRSALFENLSNGYISIDPRFPPLARGAAFPFNAFFVPFLCLVPLICMLSILWYKEVASWISGVLH
jgi:4-amino-4-deoxy-L-arabinose transferase-like glycosyltransferase